MKIEILRDFLGGRWVAKVDGFNIIPPDECSTTVGHLLRWLGDLDDKIKADASDNGGLADLVQAQQTPKKNGAPA